MTSRRPEFLQHFDRNDLDRLAGLVRDLEVEVDDGNERLRLLDRRLEASAAMVSDARQNLRRYSRMRALDTTMKGTAWFVGPLAAVVGLVSGTLAAVPAGLMTIVIYRIVRTNWRALDEAKGRAPLWAARLTSEAKLQETTTSELTSLIQRRGEDGEFRLLMEDVDAVLGTLRKGQRSFADAYGALVEPGHPLYDEYGMVSRPLLPGKLQARWDEAFAHIVLAADHGRIDSASTRMLVRSAMKDVVAGRDHGALER